ESGSDHTWHASALEGLVTVAVIDASSTRSLHTSTSAVRNYIDDKLLQATTLYKATPLPDSAEGRSLLVFLYCLSVLRHARLPVAYFSEGGLRSLASTSIIHPTDYGAYSRLVEGAWRSSGSQVVTSEVSPSAVSSILSNLHGPWLLHLNTCERLSVLETTASLYSSLGFRRKEAFILWEFLSCLMMGLQRGTPSARSVHGDIPSPGHVANTAAPGSRAQAIREVLAVLKYVCRVLGVNLEAVKLHGSSEHPGVVANSASTLIQQYEQEEMEPYHQTFGWIELQLDVVREAVALAEALSALARQAGPQDRSCPVRVSSLRTILATIHSSPSLPEVQAPIESPASLLDSPSSGVPLSSCTRSDGEGTHTLLYDFRPTTADQTPFRAVQNDSLEFVATLTNPFLFDLELHHLSLSTSGATVETQPISCRVPALSKITTVLAAKPTRTGTLTVRGCFVQVPGCPVQEIILPSHSDRDLALLTEKRRAVAYEILCGKHSVKSFPWHKSKRMVRPRIPISSLRFWECEVVPEQPLLAIVGSSIPLQVMTLYNGERSEIRLTVRNLSPLPVDFLQLSLHDSTLGPAQQALSKGNLSAFEAYEIVHGLNSTPALSWKPGKDRAAGSIPNQNSTLVIDCFGKIRTTSGAVELSYSFAERPESAASGVFYTRRLIYPFTITIECMLECSGMDIIPFSSSSVDADFHRRLTTEGDQVRNLSGLAFDVMFSCKEHDVVQATTIPSGSTSSVTLPIRKIILPNQPIPNVSDFNQMVAGESDITDEERNTQQQLFWYREALLNSVRGEWKAGNRSGVISLREQHMSADMLERLRFRGAMIELSLVEQSNKAVPTDGGKYIPPSNQFVVLRARTHHLLFTDERAPFTMDLELAPGHPIVFEGTLTGVPLGYLEANEERDFPFGICFLSSGTFVLSAELRRMRSPAEHGLEVCTDRTYITALVMDS
ncbi:hypothetical protein FA13DRAFT_1620468, partial [Coprinellus micaceus]